MGHYKLHTKKGDTHTTCGTKLATSLKPDESKTVDISIDGRMRTKVKLEGLRNVHW